MKPVAFFFFLFFCTNLFSQEYIQKLPIVDVHVHSSIRGFNSRNTSKASIWQHQENDCSGRISNLFKFASHEVPKYTQSNLEAMIKSGNRLSYLSLTPLEREMLTARLLNEEKKGGPTMSCVSGLENINIYENDKKADYFKDFKDNIKWLENQMQAKHFYQGQDFKFELIKNRSQLKENLDNPNKISLILNVEGGHSFGYSLSNKNDYQDSAHQAYYFKNLRYVKGSENLNGSYFEYPVLALNINHFFWNGLSGHARTFTMAQNFIFGGGDGVDEGMTDFGKKVITEMLDIKAGRRILVDIKHMSLASRKWYYNFIDSFAVQGDTIPVFSSHSTISGLSMFSKEYLDKDNKAKNRKSYLNHWTISLSKEDITKIVNTNGLLGLIMDKYKLCGKKGKKAMDETLAGTIQRRKVNLKIILANIFTAINAYEGKKAWDHIAIGSDFDGMIIPFETYSSSAQLDNLAKDLHNFFEHPTDIFNLFTKEEIISLMYDYSPEELVKKIMSENALSFSFRNLPEK